MSFSPFVSLWSEDADPLSEALHVYILPALLVIRGRRRGRWNQVSRVRQNVLLGEDFPAAVVTLMGDVAFTKFGLQLPQVQPGLIILTNESKQRGKYVV